MNERSGFIPSVPFPLYCTAFLPDDTPKAIVVMVDPLGEEKRAAYRMFVRLARSLANQQVACMKFDLSGTGDSAGSHQDATVEQWLNDICEATRVLRSLAQTDSPLVLIGARGGALLAAEAAQQLPVQSLILPEPILTGEDFLRDCERRQAIKNMTEGNSQTAETAAETWSHGKSVDFGGFLYSPTLADGLRNLTVLSSLQQLPASCSVRVIRVSASSKLPPTWQPLADRTVIVRDKPFWGQLDYYESDFVNLAIMDAILLAPSP